MITETKELYGYRLKSKEDQEFIAEYYGIPTPAELKGFKISGLREFYREHFYIDTFYEALLGIPANGIVESIGSLKDRKFTSPTATMRKYKGE